MIPYRRDRTVLNLQFDETELKGLEVNVRALNVGELIEMTEAGEGKIGPDGKVDVGSVNTDDLKTMFSMLGDALQSWNLEFETEQEGIYEQVEPTLKGILTQEVDFIMEIINVWMTAVAGVEPELKDDLSSGGTSLELTRLPMDG